MALPANDAFSLGLAHDQPRRSSSRTRTPSLPRRSSSPKVSSPPPAFSPPPSGINMTGAPTGKRGHKRKASSRQEQDSVSLSSPATIEELVEEVEGRNLAREARKAHVRNGSASSACNKRGPGKDKPNDSAVAKIDWEIPRKALHSSIGMCSSSRASIFLLSTLFSSSPTASAVRSNSLTDPLASVCYIFRLFHDIPLDVKWLTRACRRRPQHSPCRTHPRRYPQTTLPYV